MLEKYRSLSGQAEDIDSYEAYKELIEVFRNATYEELFDWMYDTENILKVLIRREAKGDQGGIRHSVEAIVKLGEIYLDLQTNYTGYTYEFIENEERKKILVGDKQ